MVSRAKVEEVLPDGSTVALSFNNYNKDNNIKITKTEEVIITDNNTTDVVPDATEQTEVTVVEEEKLEAVNEQPKSTEQRFSKHNKKHRNRYNNNKLDADDSGNNGTDSVAEATVSADDEVAVETIDIESIL